MTQPNRTLPGTTYMLTRRCSERLFFLRPDPLVNQVFKCVLAYAAAKTGVWVHMALSAASFRLGVQGAVLAHSAGATPA